MPAKSTIRQWAAVRPNQVVRAPLKRTLLDPDSTVSTRIFAGGCCGNSAGKSVASAVNLSFTQRGKKPRRVQNTPLLFFGGTAVHPDQGRFRERMEMQFETDERG